MVDLPFHHSFIVWSLAHDANRQQSSCFDIGQIRSLMHGRVNSLKTRDLSLRKKSLLLVGH